MPLSLPALWDGEAGLEVDLSTYHKVSVAPGTIKVPHDKNVTLTLSMFILVPFNQHLF